MRRTDDDCHKSSPVGLSTPSFAGKDVNRPQLAAMVNFVREGDVGACIRWIAWPATSTTCAASSGS